MTLFIIILFALTYVGMALGAFPALRVDRAGIAMIVAVVLVAVGAVPGRRAWPAPSISRPCCCSAA